MEVSFYVLNLQRPKVLADFLVSKTRWAMCEVVIEECAKRPSLVGETLTYRGHIPSCAPYFMFSTKVTFMKSKSKTIGPVSRNTEISFSYRGGTHLTLGFRAYLSKEVFSRTEEKISVPQDITSFTQLRESPSFYNNCDYYRLGFEELIRMFFPQTPVFKIWQMSVDMMKTLIDKFLSEKPWLLMFPKWTEMFKVKRLSHVKMIAARQRYRVVCPRETRLALQFYNFILRLRKHTGHTLFSTNKMITTYCLEHIPSESAEFYRFLPQILSYLAFKGILFLDEAKSEFVLLEDEKVCTKTWKLLQEIKAKNDDQIKTKHEISLNHLTEEQSAAVHHVQDNWLTMILGPPGHGKSEAIVSIVKKHPKVLVCTYVGMAVDMLKGRLDKDVEVHTIHHIYYKLMYDRKGLTRKWLSKFQVLVIDEFANVGIRLFSKLLQCVSHFMRIVLVGDLDQINPIEPGCPFKDLAETYPEKVFYFTQNLRADDDAHALVDAAVHVKNNELDRLNFRTRCLRLVPRNGPDAMGAILDKYLRWHASHIMDFQILALMNEHRNAINLFVETWLLENQVLFMEGPCPTIRKNFQLFVGQKITFTKNIKKNPETKFPGVRNGELAQISDVSYNRRSGAITLKLAPSGKVVSLGDGDSQVPTTTIDRGYAITCNKSQGSEWQHILFWIHDNLQYHWTREYLYVAVSRAKSSVVIAGDRAELRQMCKQKSAERNTYFKRLIETTTNTDTDNDDTTEEF